MQDLPNVPAPARDEQRCGPTTALVPILHVSTRIEEAGHLGHVTALYHVVESGSPARKEQGRSSLRKGVLGVVGGVGRWKRACR